MATTAARRTAPAHTRAVAKAARSDWLSLGEAAQRLGVDPDTLRRWADSGKVEVFLTPGGHRRFPRTTIEALIPSPPRATRQRSLHGIGAPVDRVAAELLRRVRAGMLATSGAWAERLEESERAAFRERGRAASELLLRYLDTTRRAERDRLLVAVEEIGREYGRDAARARLSLADATAALLFFRTQFMAELASVAHRRSLTAPQTTLLFEEADRALDRILLALIAAHQESR